MCKTNMKEITEDIKYVTKQASLSRNNEHIYTLRISNRKDNYFLQVSCYFIIIKHYFLPAVILHVNNKVYRTQIYTMRLIIFVVSVYVARVRVKI